MHSDSRKFTDQQLWEAFCYVAGEFSDDEEETFEQRMLEDGMLCEAVLYAAAQSTAIASAQLIEQRRVTLVCAPVAVSVPGRARSSKMIAGLVAAGCCLLLAVLTSTVSPSSSKSAQIVNRTSQAELLVSFWTRESRLDHSHESEGPDLLNQEIEVPEWLFAAVALPLTDEAGDSKRESEETKDWF